MEDITYTISTLVEIGISISMMIGGIVPFIPQYKEIRRLEDASGFSLHVCLVLLVANTLRISFWFGHPFELPLLIQSIVGIGGMLLLIQLCVKMKNKSALTRGKERHFFDFDSEYFWAWTDFLSYIEFMTVFASAVGLLMFLFLDVSWFVELIGFLALFCEATLGVPQFYKNYNNASTEGMNKSMVGMWTMGDIFKTFLFLTRNAPVQFAICGSLQVLIDLAIFTQIWLYSSPAVVKAKVDR